MKKAIFDNNRPFLINFDLYNGQMIGWWNHFINQFCIQIFVPKVMFNIIAEVYLTGLSLKILFFPYGLILIRISCTTLEEDYSSSSKPLSQCKNCVATYVAGLLISIIQNVNEAI